VALQPQVKYAIVIIAAKEVQKCELHGTTDAKSFPFQMGQ
jgi:hypothetical protein